MAKWESSNPGLVIAGEAFLLAFCAVGPVRRDSQSRNTLRWIMQIASTSGLGDTRNAVYRSGYFEERSRVSRAN